MSITRNNLKLLSNYQYKFIQKFGFALDYIDDIWAYQSKIGLERDELSKLSNDDQDLVKTYNLLMDSANTTATGIIRLLSGNIYSDAFSLLRILYETAAIMYYGNQNEENKIEIYETFFQSHLNAKEKSQVEWKLIQKAEKIFESQKDEIIKIKQFLNNFGSHLSSNKILLGNVTLLGDKIASIIFNPNFNKKLYLMVIDMLFSSLGIIIEEYTKCFIKYNGASEANLLEIKKLITRFFNNIRPKLQSFIKDN